MSRPFTAELIVEEYLRGSRIDGFLVRHFRNYTRYRLARMVQNGLVRIDDVPAVVSSRVKTGQRVIVRLVDPPDKLLRPEPMPLEILFEDPWIVVLNKPAGLIAHPVGDLHSGTLVNALQHHLDQQTPVRGLLRPGIVHRLDGETSGVVVVTKEHLSHRRLSIQFQNEQVSKSYVALVEGLVEDDQGTIDLPIGRVPGGESILMSCSPEARHPRPAQTRFTVLNRFDDHTLLRAEPLTGRNHQIRVHLASIGHPVLADAFYGRFGRIKELRLENDHGEPLITRQALHADRLAFAHPITGAPMTFNAPLPADMRNALMQLPWQGGMLNR